MIVLEEINRAEDLKSLRSEWSALYERSPWSTPLHSAEWLVPWWERFGFGELWVLALRSEGRLVGLAPLFIHPYRERTVTRQVSPLGIGITDYLDFLLEPELAHAGIRVILDHLWRRRELWDSADLPGQRSGCPLLRASAADGLHVKITPDDPSPVLKLPADKEGLLAQISPSQRKALRHGEQLEASGSLAYAEAGEHNLQLLLAELFRLHNSRWNGRTCAGSLADAKVQQFHGEIAKNFLNRGWLRVSSLTSNGSIIAVLYGFVSDHTAYYYQTGFDSQFRRLSPGTLIIGRAIEQAIRDGLCELDFLRGQETYKYRWGACDRQTYRVSLTHD